MQGCANGCVVGRRTRQYFQTCKKVGQKSVNRKESCPQYFLRHFLLTMVGQLVKRPPPNRRGLGTSLGGVDRSGA